MLRPPSSLARTQPATPSLLPSSRRSAHTQASLAGFAIDCPTRPPTADRLEQWASAAYRALFACPTVGVERNPRLKLAHRRGRTHSGAANVLRLAPCRLRPSGSRPLSYRLRAALGEAWRVWAWVEHVRCERTPPRLSTRPTRCSAALFPTNPRHPGSQPHRWPRRLTKARCLTAIWGFRQRPGSRHRWSRRWHGSVTCQHPAPAVALRFSRVQLSFCLAVHAGLCRQIPRIRHLS
jgi:hypothetical protein